MKKHDTGSSIPARGRRSIWTPANKSSETGSSDPSNPVEWGRRDRISCAGCGLASEHQGARQFTLEELEEATKNFSESNIVGTGSFGLVYKGLLLDGTIVAIKRRVSVPRQAFTEQVRILSEIRHRNLVTLIGYCQEGGLQMLIFEYLPNGSISGHLYDSEQHSLTRLEFKQRLAVAIGAAKGLAHLHGLSPPVVHKDFKTSNVLVDENFIAKVADAGVFKLLQGTGEVEAHMGSNDLIDCRLGGGFTSEGMKELIALTLQCLNPSGHSRPKMRAVVVELDRILEMEMALTMVMGDGTAIILLLEGDKRNQEREYTDAFSETFFRHAIARGSQLEQDLETVITVLQPGPLGILEHKFSAAEVQEAKAIVQSAVENWRRNSAFERNGRVWQQSKSATSQE
ncbi:STYKc [Musa troglodytarum]|uniref:non-specific serine/threonine protein kinase n=1 Tax=Musa troglodytarum TaxID=320322 RepID=A0A9E7HFT7_9LILI|nr:STYKc [Musa troglodytarum]